jgi:hypothetical protein
VFKQAQFASMGSSMAALHILSLPLHAAARHLPQANFANSFAR